MKPQRVLIVGSTSFVGRRIVAALKNTPWATVVSSEAAAAPLGNIDAVVNASMGSAAAITAAATTLYPALAAQAPGARVVHLSSMTVYGTQDGTFAETETLPEHPHGSYAAAHVAAEILAQKSGHCIVLRPGVEYGPDCPAWSTRVAAWLTQRRIGDLGAGGDGSANLIYIDDLVAAVLASLKVELSGNHVFNLAMAAPPSWNEYLIAFALALRAVPVRRMTARRWSIETKVLAAPLKIAELAALKLSAARSWLPPPIPPSFKHLCRQEIRLEVQQIERQLGMRWTPLSQGLQATARWYTGR